MPSTAKPAVSQKMPLTPITRSSSGPANIANMKDTPIVIPIVAIAFVRCSSRVRSAASAIGAALGLIGWLVPHQWWRTLAIVSAAISLVTVVIYWNALMLFFPHKVGALGVDIATLVCLLGTNWPTEQAIGF